MFFLTLDVFEVQFLILISLVEIQNEFDWYYKAIVNNITYSELQKPWYSKDKFNDDFLEIKWKYQKYMEYDLKQNDRVKHFFFCLTSQMFHCYWVQFRLLTQK